MGWTEELGAWEFGFVFLQSRPVGLRDERDPFHKFVPRNCEGDGSVTGDLGAIGVEKVRRSVAEDFETGVFLPTGTDEDAFVDVGESGESCVGLVA